MPTVTFNHTGAAQSWVVPANVHTINIEAWGAQGGSGNGIGPLTPGGEGGYSKGVLKVTPGETLHVFVGGQGQNVTSPGPIGGGFNGGGRAGGLPLANSTRGGGGGGSDVRQGGNGVANRKIVAGGGGGTGGAGFLGGAGGGLVGADGTESVAGNKGLGGTQNAGGGTTDGNCNPGAVFAGGDTTTNFLCSGGGGGRFGGGAGNGGGGGSGYVGGVLGGFTSQGGRQGNGLVIFRIDAALQCPKDVCIVTSRCFFPVYYTVKGEGTGEIICTPPSGSCFPQGTTRVDCYAQLDRSVKCHFFVTVRTPR